ncbi:MAG: hypothetical protein ACI4SG_07295 [Oligosphaeraceae bacterium]
MKRFFLFLLTVLATVGCLNAQEIPLSGNALPEEELQGEERDWGVALSVSYASHYFDKGVYANTEPIFQGDLEVTWKDFFLGVTGMLDCTDMNDHRQSFEEWDWTIGWRPVLGGEWEGPVQGVEFQVAYMRYVYPRSREDDSHEINLAMNVQTFLTPGIDLYYDFEDSIFYGNVNVSQTISLADRLDWNLGAQLWWGNHRFQLRDFEVRDNAPFSVVAETSLEYSLCDGISFGPFAAGGWALGHKMRECWKEADDQSAFNWVAGVCLNLEF